MKQQKKKHTKLKIVLMAILVILMMLTIGSGVYIKNYYKADETTVDQYLARADDYDIQISEKPGKYIVFEPEEPKAGFIFYPGGKVEYTSYVPLMELCAEKDILCILVHMPGNLAIFDQDAAKDVRKLYPDVEDWYIGGHSLGGVVAGFYLKDHVEDYEGYILLASYSTKNLSDSDLKVLCLYGSEDQVMGSDPVYKHQGNLPEDTEIQVIDGGCHAYFGSYGPQKGDGEPFISNEEQLLLTVDEIVELILE